MLRQTFNQMPKELVEAARLDRAGEWKIVTRLFLSDGAADSCKQWRS